MRPLHIVLGTPSSRGTIMTQTVLSMMRLSHTFHELGISWSFANVDAAEIGHARNTMAAHALHQPNVTHLLFVDDDMDFEPEAVVDLLRADKPLIGCICPKRSLDVRKLYEAARAGLPFEDARVRALTFITKALPDGRVEIRDGLARLHAIGMGVTLIRREVLETLVARKLALPRAIRDGARDDFGNERLYGFFDSIVDEASGDAMSEDISFCRRWTDAGGEVWGLASRPIGHVGTLNFKGSYLDQARAGGP